MRQTVIEPESETTVKDLSVELTNAHVPLAEDGLIAAPGTEITIEQAEKIGAVNEEAAAWNRKRAQVVDAKRKGQAGVQWGTDDPIELFGMVRDVWHSGISIRVKRELPDQVQHSTLKLDQFRTGDEMLAYVRKTFHKRSVEATYKFEFMVGQSTTCRAVGRATLPDTMDEESPMQQQPPPGYIVVQQQPAQPQQPPPPQPPPQPYAQPSYAQQPPPQTYAPPQPAPPYAQPLPPSPSIEEIVARVVSALLPALQPALHPQQPTPAPHVAASPPAAPADPYLAFIFQMLQQKDHQIAEILAARSAQPPQVVAAAPQPAAAPQTIAQQIESVLEIRKLLERLSPPAAAAAGSMVAAHASGGGDGESAMLTVMPIDPNDPDGPALTLKANGDVHMGATLLGFLGKAPRWVRNGVDMAIETNKKLEDARAAAQQPHVVQTQVVQQQPPRRQPLPAPPPPAPTGGQVVNGAAPGAAPAHDASAMPGFG